MKIAVFSDIHSNLEALEAIMDDINKSDFDKVICLGDTIGLATNPGECLNLLFKNNVEVLLGNHDLYYLNGTNIDTDMTDEEIKHHNFIKNKLNKSYMNELKKCKLEYILSYNNKTISFKHFFIKDINNKYPFYSLKILYNKEINKILNDCNDNMVIYGHEHKPTNFKYQNGIAIGLGSSGCVTSDETFYTIIEINDKIKITKRKVIYDRKKFVNKLKKEKYPEREFIAKIFFGVDV